MVVAAHQLHLDTLPPFLPFRQGTGPTLN